MCDIVPVHSSFTLETVNILQFHIVDTFSESVFEMSETFGGS